MPHRILVSNLGYARDIDGALAAHVLRSWRHVRTPLAVQKASLDAYRRIVRETEPDLCCMIEIDTGSFGSCYFNQFDYVSDPDYPLRHASSKYATGSKLGEWALTRGKCNGFMARHPYEFERLYFSRGSKRLLYRIVLAPELVLFFTHLALGPVTRTLQLKELRALADAEKGEVLIAGDFNILAGLRELELFLSDGRYHLLNDPECGTFTLLGKHYMLDLCLASRKAAEHCTLAIIDQPFSDHDALRIDISN